MTNDIYLVGDKTSIHVYEGMTIVDIYDKDSGVPKFVTGFPRLDNELDITTKAESRDKVKINVDVKEEGNGADTDGDILDKDWAKNRSREIRKEIKELREMVDSNILYLKTERVKEIRDKIENLLAERDENTYKYGLAGKEFNRLYEEKNDIRTNWQGAEFNRITSEMLELYLRKNADYGNSFEQSLDEDGLLVSKIKLKDKIKRFSQLIENDAKIDDETMRDTLIDLANYAVMTIMWLDENE